MFFGIVILSGVGGTAIVVVLARHVTPFCHISLFLLSEAARCHYGVIPGSLEIIRMLGNVNKLPKLPVSASFQ